MGRFSKIHFFKISQKHSKQFLSEHDKWHKNDFRQDISNMILSN